MPKFRKKPVVIEAVKFNGTNGAEVCLFTHQVLEATGKGELIISTLEGDHIASTGDWIIKGIKGEFYPCKPDIFAATYEPVTD